ncbi:LXG domain-containing protein [Fictibacillus aquaticus]|uniref:LXG domain-containing protein n=1 Tax=Fictibacillus aquaticus TaxID=2021314 RepID=A0A235F6T7_9BACL|nr:LXG domain-containing protein [Fictibacillus aquaticus]OYD56657.1 hypothetical protein CGZ90_16745 [Fictibacillus aquaticus]
MKTLDASSLISGIDNILNKLAVQSEKMQQIEEAVRGLTELGESLKGNGGDAIKSFYQECHLPFLSYYQIMTADYIMALNGIVSSLQGFEPARNGFIKESFLLNEVEDGLQKIKRVTENLTNETNAVLSSVQDIVSLPELDDWTVVQEVSTAKKDKDLTVQILHEFDSQQTNELVSVSNHVHNMNSYVTQISSMFQNRDLTVSNYKSGSLLEKLSNSSIGGVGGSNSGNLGNPGDVSKNAVEILTSYENTKNLDLEKDLKEEEELQSLVDYLWKGTKDSIPPLVIIGLAQSTGLLRIEFTKKKNHYTFKYNKKVLNFLKGKSGPENIRNLIRTLDKKSKQNAKIEKLLKSKDSNVKQARYVDTRTKLQKAEAKALKMATGNRPVHETVKQKVFKHTDRAMLIEKGKFAKLAGKGAGAGAAVISTGTGIYNVYSRWDEVGNKKGKDLYEARGRIIGEEVNKAVGSATGAAVGTYVGAAIGGALSGPFAPFGAAAGAVIGGAIGASVGEWGSKYTSKWMSDAGASVGKAVHNVKEKAGKAIDSAKEKLDDVKDKVFGWL